MSMMQDTIVALSSGHPPSGVAVIRVSGGQCRFAIETLAGQLPPEREAALRILKDHRGDILDRSLVLWFPGPRSFTGEDCAEFHVHGGRAVVAAVLEALSAMAGIRIAEAGEFSRRAFENGKLDLTEIEGLSDLINAETEAQRRQAIVHSSGKLGERVEAWRQRLVRIRAMIEANFDFSDEEDIPGDEAERALGQVGPLATEIRVFLDDRRHGEIVRDGLQVVIMGRPNAGKSSLLNALARRDVAIVTEEAGTTRDLIEVRLDLEGYAVNLVDTAGLRQTESAVEAEGIRRARGRASEADVVLWLVDVSVDGWELTIKQDRSVIPDGAVIVCAKDDEGVHGKAGLSVQREGGLENLLGLLGERLGVLSGVGETLTVSRQRHRDALSECAKHLELVAGASNMAVDLAAEHMREAAHSLGRVTGRVDVEQLLDVIFSEFCVGK